MDMTSVNLNDYVRPDMLIIIAVCYSFGVMLKSTPYIKNWIIPYLLTILSVVLCFLWIYSSEGGTKQLTAIIFDSVTQGILCSASAVYVNQLFKQAMKK